MGDELKKIKKRLDELAKAQIELQSFVLNQQEFIKKVVKQTIEELKLGEADPLKAEVMRNVNKNKKRLMMRKILNLTIKQIELSELKFLVVDQLGFCSKASFYRYITELKKAGFLEFLTINNKQFVIAKPEAIKIRTPQ